MKRRVLPLLIGSLLLPLGCGGGDEPTAPTFATLTVTTASLPDGAENFAYNQTLAATGGDGSYSWALAADSGLLPSGLSLATNGDITGSPTAGLRTAPVA